MNPRGNIKHGGHGTLTYARWKSMMQRCHNPNADNYPRYGGRGIKVCERWRDFPAFRADMGECPDKAMTLDRIDSDGNYEPGNCRWLTKAAQNGNRKSHAVMLTHDGQTHSLTEWSAIVGIPASVLTQRNADGWTAERILTTPVRARAKRSGGETRAAG
jgi:hypothetical protein